MRSEAIMSQSHLHLSQDITLLHGRFTTRTSHDDRFTIHVHVL
jgi:hypothetical protein